MGTFLFTTSSTPALGPTQHPIHWAVGALALGVKWPGLEVYYLPLPSAEVKNASTPPFCLHGVVLS